MLTLPRSGLAHNCSLSTFFLNEHRHHLLTPRICLHVDCCLLKANVVEISPVANLGGSVTFTSCEFNDNRGAEVSPPCPIGLH